MEIQSAMTPNAIESSLRLLEIEAADVQRVDLLRRLTEWDYVIPANHCDAMQILVNPEGMANGTTAISRATSCGIEQRMEGAVEGFASVFFSLPTDLRQQEWKRLFSLCERFPGLRHWLQDLESALDVEDIPVFENEKLNEFVNGCCDVFVARHYDRARLRQKLISQYCLDSSFWKTFTWNLKLQHAHFVTKVAGWINDLAELKLDESEWLEPLRPMTKSAPARGKAETDNYSGAWIAFVIILVLRLIVSGSQSTSNSAIKPISIPHTSSRSYPATSPGQTDLPLSPGLSPEAKQKMMNELQEFLKRKNDEREGIRHQETPVSPPPQTSEQ